MKTKFIATALTLSIALPVAFATPTLAATERPVGCADGTVQKAVDSQTDAQACRGHGGVRKLSAPKLKFKAVGTSSSTKAGNPDGSYGGKNYASAWTAACLNEFGPGAHYPDAALLELCLNY